MYVERKAPSSTHTLTNRINVEFNVCILNTHAYREREQRSINDPQIDCNLHKKPSRKAQADVSYIYLLLKFIEIFDILHLSLFIIIAISCKLFHYFVDYFLTNEHHPDTP